MTDIKKKKNIYAKSLQNPKYRQRVVLNKKKNIIARIKTMNEIGSRKVFDRGLYQVADRDAKQATLKYIKDMNYTTIDTSERKDFDIICKAITEIHHLYEVEIKYSWKGTWPPTWKEIRIPYRKKRLIDKWKKNILMLYLHS